VVSEPFQKRPAKDVIFRDLCPEDREWMPVGAVWKPYSLMTAPAASRFIDLLAHICGDGNGEAGRSATHRNNRSGGSRKSPLIVTVRVSGRRGTKPAQKGNAVFVIIVSLAFLWRSGKPSPPQVCCRFPLGILPSKRRRIVCYGLHRLRDLRCPNLRFDR
jgi:hypothetical protein